MSNATNLDLYDKTSSCAFIHTFSGNELYFLDPQPEQIVIADIVNNLSNNCRYCGNINSFYSVAEHSVLIAKEVLRLTGNKEAAFSALMHDATEAYLCDIPRPIKPYLKGYIEMETKLQEVIYKKYNISPVCKLTKWFDCNIVADEASVLFDNKPDWVNQYEMTGVVIEALSPMKAKESFEIMLIQLGKYYLLDKGV